MKKIKICLVGANGRMGQEITKKMYASKNFEASVAIVRTGSATGFRKSAKNFSGLKPSDAEVVIDFSTPQMLAESLSFCLRHRLPLVTGVTGLSVADQKALALAAKKIPILNAPNMSVGVAVLKAAISLMAELKGFDFQIVESHHRHKKDKPGGTALALHAELQRVTKKNWPEPLALRLGGIVGEHEVVAASEGEVIRFSHEALNRGVFADGALRAAAFIIKQKAGLYKIEDLLGGTI